jgi:hypothetical protein
LPSWVVPGACFNAASPPAPARVRVIAAGLTIGSTGVRRFRARVSGHSGTRPTGSRQGGTVRSSD